MAEARNNFLSSKMNKDLEQRLVPNNEYRDAQNVMISRSDGDDVGSLENVLGNYKITDFGYTNSCRAEIIGNFMDVTGNRVFVFITDYTDSSADQLSNFAYSSSVCAIKMIDLTNNNVISLVEGYFLNFSKNKPVFSCNLVEQYLFWTDDRNQPRKINIDKANPNDNPNPSYYTCEDQISVAKYYPYQSPLLIDNAIVSCNMTSDGGANTVYSVNDVLFLRSSVANQSGRGARIRIDSLNPNGSIRNYTIISIGVGYITGSCILVGSVNSSTQVGTATFNIEVTTQSTMQDRTSQYLPDDQSENPFYDSNFEGDKDFLEDKFVRFGWRFKTEDNEYSLISPFTQSAFVPKQDGYFITNDQEKRTYTTTELEFMVNKVNYVRVVIPSPYKTWADAISRFKISEIDIIYKQSNLTSLNVIESLKVDSALVTDYSGQTVLLYEYLSQKPYKTLPQKDLTRVYDKTPVRAATQEFVEDAIAYGNYLDKHTPPATLPYYVSASTKWKYDSNTAYTGETTRIEYQNHTLKQNRTYQVGIVLSDRYGRQSTVILSGDNKANTIFHPYKTGQNYDVHDFAQTTTNFSQYTSGVTGDYLLTAFDSTSSPKIPFDTWPGDSLKITFLNQIQSTFSSTNGSPGLYNPFGKVSFIKIVQAGSGLADASYVDLTSAKGGNGLGISITTAGGAVSGVTINNPGLDFLVGDQITITGGESDCILEIGALQEPNPTGWHSYKIVVKQQENEYYNVYTPGILNGYIDGEGPNVGILESGVDQSNGNYIQNLKGATLDDPTFHVQLFGDNINKVPRDLSQLGPTQNKFRTARPTLASDPDYYSFVDPTDAGKTFSADPYDVDDQIRLKSRDRARDLDAGSIITNSSVKLIPRVVNYTGPMGDTNGYTYSTDSVGARSGSTIIEPKNTFFANLYGSFNKQWYPDQRVLEITTIGTSTELGLWDVTANPPFNEAYSFYNFQDNPLMSKGEVQLNTTLSITNQQNELSYLGVRGPSPYAGKLTYEAWKGSWVSGGYTNIGDNPGNKYGTNYTKETKNVGIIYYSYKSIIEESGGTEAAPYNYCGNFGGGVGFSGPRPTGTFGLLGSKGQNLLVNIDEVHEAISSADKNGTLQMNTNAPTSYYLASISVSNSNGENGVRGYNIYGFPWHLQKILSEQESATCGGGTAFEYQFAAKIKSGDAEGASYFTVKLNPNPGNMQPQLAVLETEPIVSKLDIYWETSTSGLIDELNTAIIEEDEFLPASLLASGGSIPEDTTPLQGQVPWGGIDLSPTPVCSGQTPLWGGPIEGNTFSQRNSPYPIGTLNTYAQDGDNNTAYSNQTGTIPTVKRYPTPILENLRAITGSGDTITFIDESIALGGDPTIRLLSYTSGDGVTVDATGVNKCESLFVLGNINGTTNLYLQFDTYYKNFTGSNNPNNYSFTFEVKTRSATYALDGEMDTTTFVNANGAAGTPYSITNKLPDIEFILGRSSTPYPTESGVQPNNFTPYNQEGGTSTTTSFGGIDGFNVGGPGGTGNYAGSKCVWLGDYDTSRWGSNTYWAPTIGNIGTFYFYNGAKKQMFAECTNNPTTTKLDWKHGSAASGTEANNNPACSSSPNITFNKNDLGGVSMTNSSLLPKLYKRIGNSLPHTYQACPTDQYSVTFSNNDTRLTINIPPGSTIIDSTSTASGTGLGRYEIWASNPGFTNGSTPTMKVYDTDTTSYTQLLGKDNNGTTYRYLWFNIT